MVFISGQMSPYLKKTLAESFVGTFDGNPILASHNMRQKMPKLFETLCFAMYNSYALIVDTYLRLGSHILIYHICRVLMLLLMFTSISCSYTINIPTISR